MKRTLMRIWKVAPILGLLAAPGFLFGVASPAAAAGRPMRLFRNDWGSAPHRR